MVWGQEWGWAHHSAAADRLYTLNIEYWKVMTSSTHQANLNFREISKQILLPNHVLCHKHIKSTRCL